MTPFGNMEPKSPSLFRLSEDCRQAYTAYFPEKVAKDRQQIGIQLYLSLCPFFPPPHNPSHRP